jgi:predicted dehydrogenase
MMRANMLRAAICGAGHWGTHLIESVQGRSGKIRFVAAVTRDPAALQPLGQRLGLALSARYADVLADPAVDAVVLATPHSQHADEIAAAAKARKHVFVEKPFTLTRASAEGAIEACRASRAAPPGRSRRCTRRPGSTACMRSARRAPWNCAAIPGSTFSISKAMCAA